MATKLNHTILAYLLALQDLPHALNEREQSSLKEVAKQLRTQPEAWNDYIEPSLIAIIQGNSPLNQSYQQYKNKLDNFGEISSDLLDLIGNNLSYSALALCHGNWSQNDDLLCHAQK